MPIDLKWTGRAVVFECTGTLIGPDIMNANETVYSDARWPNTHAQIVNLLKLDAANVTDIELEQIAETEERGSALNPDARVVVVRPKSSDPSVKKLVTSWFMAVHDDVSFTIRFTETLEEAHSLL